MLPTARPVAPRPEHVLVQTDLTPTLSQWVAAERVLVQTALTPTLCQWVPALELIHPHVALGPCAPF